MTYMPGKISPKFPIILTSYEKYPIKYGPFLINQTPRRNKKEKNERERT
uniref:Uncharacterized protein n=1 Tax=Vitis vinifera TaxID=29760 RepID=F6H4R8_VITVI